jgi:hypothetical protein
MRYFAISAKTGVGVQDCLQFLSSRLAEVTEKMPV